MGRPPLYVLPLPSDENGCWIWPGHKDPDGYGRRPATEVRSYHELQTRTCLRRGQHLRAGQRHEGLPRLHPRARPSIPTQEGCRMSDPEDTFFCTGCVSPDRTDNCGHADEPTCQGCCPRDHADELLREALRDWGRPA